MVKLISEIRIYDCEYEYYFISNLNTIYYKHLVSDTISVVLLLKITF